MGNERNNIANMDEMAFIRAQVQNLFEEDLPRVLGLLILSYLEDKEVCIGVWGAEQGRSGKGEGEFNLPTSITVLPSGDLAVLDAGNYRIQILSQEGKFLRTWGKRGRTAPGEFSVAYGITSLPSGEVIVADTNNNRIQVFTSEGKFLRMWGTEQGGIGRKLGEFALPCHITPLPSGEVVITDVHNHRIQVFTSEGKLHAKHAAPQCVRMWGASEAGEGKGEFNWPCGVTSLPSGEIIVADTNNHRIQVFTPEGKFLRMWGKRGREAPGEFNYPTSVTYHTLYNEVMVADKDNHRIQVFTLEGKFLRMWGKEGEGIGEFNRPNDIISLSSGEIVVADTYNHRIQVFRTMLD